MAFRIHDVALHLMTSNGAQPGTCTCGPASGNAPKPPCAQASSPGGGKPGGPKRRVLAALRAQLRETPAPPM
jgi:hypothetical protein